MKTYSEIREELDEATGRQRVIGAIAAGALATSGVSQLDKAPAETVKHPKTGVTRQVVQTEPHSKSSGEFEVNGVRYRAHFPNLAYKLKQ